MHAHPHSLVSQYVFISIVFVDRRVLAFHVRKNVGESDQEISQSYTAILPTAYLTPLDMKPFIEDFAHKR